MATEAQIQREFNKSIRSIVDGTRFGALRNAIARRDYDAALRAMDVEEAAFDGLRAMLLETYASGGVNAVTGTRWPVNVRWNSATPQAEAYGRNIIGRHITEITNDTRDAVRRVIGDGVAFERSPNRIALDLVGRVGRNGKREGGIVGLNRPQTEWVGNMRRYLDVWPDWPSIQRMGARDKRFDSIIRQAYETATPLTQAQIDRITQAYSNNLLRSRGLTIARTEHGAAINAGMYEGFRQGAEKTGIPVESLEKEWIHGGIHKYERQTHVAASGDRVTGLNTPFNVGGVYMLYPHDPSAPASEVINCQCRYRVRVPRNWRQYG